MPQSELYMNYTWTVQKNSGTVHVWFILFKYSACAVNVQFMYRQFMYSSIIVLVQFNPFLCMMIIWRPENQVSPPSLAYSMQNSTSYTSSRLGGKILYFSFDRLVDYYRVSQCRYYRRITKECMYVIAKRNLLVKITTTPNYHFSTRIVLKQWQRWQWMDKNRMRGTMQFHQHNHWPLASAVNEANF